MDNIFLVTDNRNEFVNSLSFNKIEFTTDILSDSDYHTFVTAIFKLKDIDKLIIPVNLANGGMSFRGLRLGMHIRLTQEIGAKRLIPILFISDQKLHSLMVLAKNNDLNLNYLLTTEGCKLVEENEDEINDYIEDNVPKPIQPQRFKTQVLNRLKILPGDAIGKHSLANQWGAFRLDDVAQTQALVNNKNLKEKQQELYFKYIRSFNDDYDNLLNVNSPLKTYSPKTIASQNKTILLIDDEANKGWSDVLSKIFVGADFQFIEDHNDFKQFINEAETKILNEEWDLILLDLRLNRMKEEKSDFVATGKIQDYSGAELLKKIKAKNRGTQVIIFTASNKAWNMKVLLDLGADGYFIKESPELGFSNDFSEKNLENFMSDVDVCFKKDYLKDVYTRKSIIEQLLQSKKGQNTDYDDFLEELKNQINISFDLLYNARIDINFVYAYLSLYKFLESIGNYKVSDALITNTSNYKWNVVNNQIEPNTGIKGVFQRIAYIHKDSLFLNDNVFLKMLYWIVKRRNAIIHPPNVPLTALVQNEINKINSEKGYLELLEVIESVLPVL